MIPVQFDYAAPDSLENAVKLLQENEKAQTLAGGHSLMIEMKLGHTSPSLLVDLRKIPGLQGISLRRETDGVLQIGAMTTYAQIAAAPEVKENYQALVDAANSIGDAQIRNWEPIGDTFAYRDLACDFPAVALAMEATFNTIAPRGIRAIVADEFVLSYEKVNLEPGAIVTSIDFPPYVIGTGSAYESFKHPASDYAICGVAALIQHSADGTVSKCRVAFTSATTPAMRLRQVEAAIEGKAPTAENILAAAQLARESVSATEEAKGEISKIFALYASLEYRAYLSNVLAEKALTRANQQAGLSA